jgi:hypothetical protein
LGAFFSLMNWAYLLAALRSGRFHSPIPLVGAICLGFGALLLPVFRWYAWAAVLLDIGTLAFLVALPRIAQELWATSRFNLLEEFVGQRGVTTVRLNLFRRGVFTLNWDRKRSPGEFGLIGMGNVGIWGKEMDMLVLRIGDARAVFRLLPETSKEGWSQLVGFPHCEENPELSLEGLELILRVRRRKI